MTEPPHVATLELANDEALELKVFIDRSVIEVFANGRAFIASRVYPIRSDSLDIFLIYEEGMEVLSFEAWKMKAIR